MHVLSLGARFKFALLDRITEILLRCMEKFSSFGQVCGSLEILACLAKLLEA